MNIPQQKKIVVLISGSGSNLQALINAEQQGTVNAHIVGVISNKPDVYGLQRAAKANIPTAVLSHKAFSAREDYDAALLALVQQYQPDLVVLAGFMRILTPAFVAPLYGKLMNIHPSLLPKYPGLHTHQRALDAGDTKAGATVHFVSPELDGGPIILQTSVPVLTNDTAETLAQRVLQQEHIIYPQAVRWFCEDRLRCHRDHATLDDKILPRTGGNS
ncbi:MAG: phosphoribosylglycinamide formyltransferase [Pseudomonadales bacterium]|jgi:phosphoribosylglycinamide formyltransferase-1|nr:phosphoribosylglycinamide formyltransferase [Pseudomonadales bacterium]